MIQLTTVSKAFSSGRGRVQALAEVSCTLEAGVFAAVAGRSGSGKSTLLGCVGGLERPDQGEISCFGTPVHRLKDRALSLFQRRQVGFVFQRGNLLSYLNVFENIGFPLTLNGVRGKARSERIEGLLERIGLFNAAKALPHELSGGEAQRVAVARAVAHNPKILLADEPTAHLDSATGREVVALMREMGRASGCTVIMATHDTDILSVADTVLYLRDGQL
jgi:putative ABC transport system ATP-binding protein